MWGDGDVGDMTGRSVGGWGFVDDVGLALGWNRDRGPALVIDVTDIRPLGALGDIAGSVASLCCRSTRVEAVA
jgi:hypothetical protein